LFAVNYQASVIRNSYFLGAAFDEGIMRTSSEDISSVKKKLTIEIESAEVDKKVDSAFKDLSKKAKIPGFRPGKVPITILERRFGKDVAEDVSRDLINESLPKAIDETDVIPLGAPILEREVLKKGQDFKYSALLEIRPKFELRDYLGIEVEKEAHSITDKDVSERIEQIRQANGNLKSEEDRVIQKDDYAVLEYEAFENDQPLEDMKTTNFMLHVGKNEFNAQFEEGLMGMKKDEEKEISVQFPQDYFNSKLAGKDIRFKVKVQDIKVMVLPELNDDFAKGLGGDLQGIEDLTNKVKEALNNQEEKRIGIELNNRLLKKITDTVQFEYPEILVESEIDYAVQSFKQSLAQRGTSLEQAGISEEKMRENFRPTSEMRVKEMLVLEEIARKENITVEEDELNEAYKQLATPMGVEAQVVRQYYEARGMVGSLQEKLTQEKTLKYLVEHAKVQEVSRDMLRENMTPEKESN
jgi:trigger factor